MSNRFDDRVAVVTGAASGIGRAIATRFLAEGGRVVAGDLDERGLADLASAEPDRTATMRCDVTVENDVADLVAASVDQFGALSVVFNVAGGQRPAPLSEMTEEDWDFTVDLCLKGVFFGIKHASRRMIDAGRGGVIVNIASLNSRVPMFGGGAYAAAKAGVASLGQTAAIELGVHGIRVATVSPGLTATPLVEPIISNPVLHDAFMQRIPLGRPATPEDIAATSLYLASDDAAYVTGVNLFVDGGWEQTAYPDLRAFFAAAPPEP